MIRNVKGSALELNLRQLLVRPGCKPVGHLLSLLRANAVYRLASNSFFPDKISLQW